VRRPATSRRPSRSPQDELAEYIGFTTPAVGYAINAGSLWRSDDGGETWRRLQIT
jgi:photosystem II stability/assembly factor-like uncharacterized protein